MGCKRHWTALFKLDSSTPNNSIVSQLPSSYQGYEQMRNPETKSRWNPKREQIEILEAIFDSGKVNPSREEIKAIRSHLQQFGEVGDANVFYWFQNRKSRSKKRQRRLQSAAENAKPIHATGSSLSLDHYSIPHNMGESSYPTMPSSAALFPKQYMHQETQQIPTVEYFIKQAAAAAAGGGEITSADNYSSGAIPSRPQDCSTFVVTEEQSYPYNLDHLHAPLISSTLTDSTVINTLDSESEGLLNVFIDGVRYEVPKGPVNVKASFGETAYLVDSNCQQVLMNERGFTFQGLQDGASYYLLNEAGAFPSAGFSDV